MSFDARTYLDPVEFARITDIRVSDPDKVLKLASKRIRRDTLSRNGKLNIVAIDHPARGSVSVASNRFAMANRLELLARIIRVLESTYIDGILASNDIHEELMLLDSMRVEKGGDSLLDNRVMIGSLNRGGLPGSAWELDDRLTGPTPESCVEFGLDGVKMLLRFDKTNPDTIKTIEYAVDMINESARLKIPMFLEPLVASRIDGKYQMSLDTDSYVEVVGISSALGNNSNYLWLKLPYCKDYEKVTAATTLPIVILGGDKTSTSIEMLQQVTEAMNVSHQVRGVMYGRNLLFPGNHDPLIVANALGKIVHGDGDINSEILALSAKTI